MEKFSSALDDISGFFAARKGLLPIIGVMLILINFCLRLFPVGWLTSTDFFLHLGVILSILGIMLAWAL